MERIGAVTAKSEDQKIEQLGHCKSLCITTSSSLVAMSQCHRLLVALSCHLLLPLLPSILHHDGNFSEAGDLCISFRPLSLLLILQKPYSCSFSSWHTSSTSKQADPGCSPLVGISPQAPAKQGPRRHQGAKSASLQITLPTSAPRRLVRTSRGPLEVSS